MAEQADARDLKSREVNTSYQFKSGCGTNDMKYKDGLNHMTEKYCLKCGNKLRSDQKKYCSNECRHNHEQMCFEKDWFAGKISGNSDGPWTQVRDRVRNYLFKKYNNKCSRCGWGEVNPFTNTIPLEVEHLDGNPYNSFPDNLTLLCPNCHSLTKTYRGANRGNGRKKTWIPKE